MVTQTQIQAQMQSEKFRLQERLEEIEQQKSMIDFLTGERKEKNLIDF